MPKIDCGSCLPGLMETLAEVQRAADGLTQRRKAALLPLIEAIIEHGRGERVPELTFVCTHNSRRSQLAQVWAQVAAAIHRIDVRSWSGGIEVTACNPRTVASLRRTGFEVTVEGDPSGQSGRTAAGNGSENPRYLVRYAHDAPPVVCFSKIYNTEGNPSRGYLAVMCCADADERCPTVTGAELRIALHYEDPKIADETPGEAQTYDTRSRQIAAEMLFVFGQVAERS